MPCITEKSVDKLYEKCAFCGKVACAERWKQITSRSIYEGCFRAEKYSCTWAIGETVFVFSQSAGKWVDGQISSVDVNDASVTLRIEYQIDKHPCRKTLKETSEHLKKIPPAADASSEISSSLHSDMPLSWSDRLDGAWRASMGGTRIR